MLCFRTSMAGWNLAIYRFTYPQYDKSVSSFYGLELQWLGGTSPYIDLLILSMINLFHHFML